MRKQTKLVAVLSAAALLALGASMTSFAAGWEKDEAGVWHFYDEDDELVTGEWKKDGGKWFYLDDDGDMLTNDWVDGDYYVGEDGAMLVNQWIKTYIDDEIDDPDEDEESWFYFGSKGKITTGDKKINGKYYFFDSEGRMYDGWYEEGGDVYYLGDEDDGSRKSGWLWLEVPEEEDHIIAGHKDDKDKCDEEGWYYFGSNGKMYKDAAKKKVNGKYYYFNDHGQMLYEWINGAKVEAGSNAQLDGKNAGATISDMLYTNVVEEGWRADGWYEIDGSEDVGTENDTDWYYFKKGEAKKASVVDDGNGLVDGKDPVYRAKIKIEGKNFCFNEKGQMQTGLQYIDGSMYYFDDNGYMQTGKLSNVEEENDSFTYYFQTKNGGNGKGVTGEKAGYLYWNGKRLEADDDYRLYKVDGVVYLVNNKGKLQKSSSKDYDIENWGGEDVELTINDDTYAVSIASLTADQKASISVPKIELLDSVIYTNGDKNDVTISKATDMKEVDYTVAGINEKYDADAADEDAEEEE